MNIKKRVSGYYKLIYAQIFITLMIWTKSLEDTS